MLLTETLIEKIQAKDFFFFETRKKQQTVVAESLVSSYSKNFPINFLFEY